MPCYVFFAAASSTNAVSLAVAKKTAIAHGVAVLRTSEGGMLVEAPSAKASALVKALPGWRHTLERKTTRLPERTMLERARLAAKKA